MVPPPRLFTDQPYPALNWPLRLEHVIESPPDQYVSLDEAKNASQEHGFTVGLDTALDPFNFTATIVLRDLNACSYQRGPFGLDFLHEPNFSLGFSYNLPAGSQAVVGPWAAAAALTLLNLHFQYKGKDKLELGLGQVGAQFDSTGKLTFPFGVQAEYHDVFTPNLSVTLSAGGSVKQPDPGDPDYLTHKDQFRVSWNPNLVLGMLFHW
jgi:hypothetical protein